MSRTAERIAREQQISVLNWMGTLLVSLIPGVNIILFIVWQFMPVKKVRKRFALAALLLTLIIEKVTRKKLAPKYEGYIHYVGLLLLLALKRAARD